MNPIGKNPFPPNHTWYKVWQTASRYAEEEMSRFNADHSKMLPAESNDRQALTEWMINGIVGRFDIRSEWLCRLMVGSYLEADWYCGEMLPAILDAELSMARDAGGMDDVSELKIRLMQREYHWKAEALKLARETEQAKNCIADGGVKTGAEGPGACTEGSNPAGNNSGGPGPRGGESTGMEAGPLADGESGTDRRKAVDAYIEEVFSRTGKRITRKDIWKSARYQTRTEFERWQRHAPNATKAAEQRFARILSQKPHLK